MGVGADAPKRLALDTSAYSWLRAGDARVIDWLSAAESIIVPATVLGELRAGFELGGRTRENLTALAEFLQEPFVSMRGVGTDEAARYGHLFAALRRAGTPIPRTTSGSPRRRSSRGPTSLHSTRTSRSCRVSSARCYQSDTADRPAERQPAHPRQQHHVAGRSPNPSARRALQPSGDRGVRHSPYALPGIGRMLSRGTAERRRTQPKESDGYLPIADVRAARRHRFHRVFEHLRAD